MMEDWQTAQANIMGKHVLEACRAAQDEIGKPVDFEASVLVLADLIRQLVALTVQKGKIDLAIDVVGKAAMHMVSGINGETDADALMEATEDDESDLVREYKESHDVDA